MNDPMLPQPVDWANVFQLEVEHFTRTDARNESLAALAAAFGDPWPWGFLSADVDETALASGEVRIGCHGIFPNGRAFARTTLTQPIGTPSEEGAETLYYSIERENDEEAPTIEKGHGACARRSLPAARIVVQRSVWVLDPTWSAPTIFIGSEHPIRRETDAALGALSGLAAGFMATLRMPGADERTATRRLRGVASALVEGIGMLEAYLASPRVTAGRLGLEARRLALGVRAAADEFEPLAHPWDPGDQRGSLRALLESTRKTASRLGLPFSALVLRREHGKGPFKTTGCPAGDLTIGIETSRATDLPAAKNWFEGAALAAPERVDDALNRRVVGCPREPIGRDSAIGVSAGPLLGLYRVKDDPAWRNDSAALALGAKTAPPKGVSFLVFVPEPHHEEDEETGSATTREEGYSALGPRASWAGSEG